MFGAPWVLFNRSRGGFALYNVTNRRWNVNLRSVRARVNGAAKRMRVCTTCLKGGKVTKA